MPTAADERPALVACLEGAVQTLGLADGLSLPADAVRTWTEYQLLKHFGQRIRLAMEQAVVNSSGCNSQVALPAADPGLVAKWLPALSRLPPVANPRLRLVCFHSAGCAEDMFSSEGTGPRRAHSPLLEWCQANDAELLAVQAPGRASRQKEAPCTSAQDMAQQVLQVLGPRLQGPVAGLHAAGAAHNGEACRGAGLGPACEAEGAAGCDGGAAGCDRGAAGRDGGRTKAVPWAIVSHSMGSWVAFELLRLMRQKGLPMPAAWFISAMPAPDIPGEERPWKQQRHLDEDQFKAECRGWDINDIVFTPGMWQMYEPMLRADFTVFDEYHFRPLTEASSVSKAPGAGQNGKGAVGGQGNGVDGKQEEEEEEEVVPPFAFPIHAFWGSQDRRVTQGMVQEWRRFTTGPFSCTRIEGNHLWPLQKQAKADWLSKVVDGLKQLA